MNARLGTVYLSKSRYCFAKIHELKHAFENLTLCLRLVGNGETLAVQYEVRRTAPANVVLCRGEFRDSPGADRFAEGRDDPAAPLWGKVGLGLDNGSTGDKRGDRGEVLWGAVRARGYRSGQPPAPWRVVDDFDQGLLTNWVNLAPLDSSNTCKVENGRLVLSSRNLPLAQLGWMGTYRQELFEISSSHTLEIEADLVAARAPHPMAGVSLIRPRLDPFTAPDRPFIVQNRCFILSRWDYSILVRDLEDASSASAEGSGRSVPRCFTHPFPIRQGDVDPAGRYLAIAEPSDQGDLEDRLAVWELQTTRKLTLAIPKDLQATGVRFSPDGHLLAVSHRDGLALIRTTDWQWARTVGKGAFFSQPLFSPGGWRLAAVRNRRELVVWDLNDFDEPLATFKCGSDLRRIVFSPDGRYLASSAANETVRVWDAAKAEPFAPPLPGTLARFSPDGTLLVVIGPESAAWLWDLTRVADDPLLVPAVRGEENLASSGDGAITAEINDHGITLTTPAGRHSLSLPVPTRLYRVRFSSDDRFLIAESPQLQAWIWDVRSRTLLGPPPSLHYEAALESPSALPLPLAAQAKPILSGLAALLGQQQPDGHGGMIPITEAARVRLFRELRRSQPTEFQPEEPNQTRWHEQQAKAAELAMDWDAAVFHWGQIQNVEARFRAPKSAACIERHLAYARQAADAVRQQAVRGRTRWSVILPRQPWVPADMLDLGRFYTTPLGEGHRSFRELGSGVRCLGGTDFDVRGIIDLKRTNQVVIPLGRVCRRIHFLNAASQTCFPREPAGTYTVKYANATSASITPLNPEHVPPYAYDRFHEVAALSRTNASLGLRATLVWSGAALGSNQRRQLAYLTRTTWELPAAHQGDSVESLQLRAGPAGSAPLIFAITVE